MQFRAVNQLKNNKIPELRAVNHPITIKYQNFELSTNSNTPQYNKKPDFRAVNQLKKKNIPEVRAVNQLNNHIRKIPELRAPPQSNIDSCSS